MNQGRNWSENGSTFVIFGRRGYVDGRNWVVPSLSGLAETDPQPQSGVLQGLVQADVASGKAHLIHHLRVDPWTALALALEGVLTVEQLKRASETVTTISCEIILAGTLRKLVVDANLDDSMVGTYDKNGRPV